MCLRNSCRILHYLLLVVGLIGSSLGEFEPAYLKVCGRDHRHSVESNLCDKGVWLNKAIEPGCICVRGVWALANGFCDEKAAILVGDGHCFDIPFAIRSAKLIGDPRDPFKPKVYVAPSTLEMFHEVQERHYTPHFVADETVIIGVNPRQVAQRKDYSICVDLDPEEYKKPVHIFQNPRRTMKEWILDHKKTFTCPELTPYQYHIGFGEMFIRGKVEPKLLVQRDCKRECPAEGSRPNITGRMMMDGSGFVPPQESFKNRPVTTFVVASNLKDKIPIYATKRLGQTNPSGRKRVKTIEERTRELEELRASVTQDREHYEKETNEQTLRMMHAHISPLLLNISGVKTSTREYQYFQLARQIVERACPQEYVPKLLVRGVIRMFRQLLWETQSVFTHSQTGDDDQFERTLRALSQCKNMTKEPSIYFTTYSDAYSNDTEEKLPLPTPERCPTPLITSVNGTDYNQTSYNTKESRYIRNMSGIFPTRFKFNSSQVDFVIETAWKIAVISHFRCSKHFNFTYAGDFSHFFHQIQSFFSTKMVKRWFYEKSIQATYSIVQMIFPSYDLKKFMFGLDACLFGVHGFSIFDFKNVWMERPKIPLTRNEFSRRNYSLPGSTSVLSTLDYAPDPVKLELPASKPKNRRGKRSVVHELGYYMWNNNARCIDNYMEPIKVRDLGYHLPEGCNSPMSL